MFQQFVDLFDFVPAHGFAEHHRGVDGETPLGKQEIDDFYDFHLVAVKADFGGAGQQAAAFGITVFFRAAVFVQLRPQFEIGAVTCTVGYGDGECGIGALRFV